ncbi:MAG: hypothetical protein HQM13_03865 [SAR324 cluster bacterium]|nr:hypothetical protein [SAR324 cluster bacterium]
MNIRIKDLTAEEQAWLAKGVISIILADAAIEKNEVDFFKRHFGVLTEEGSVISVESLVNNLKSQKTPDMWEIEIFDPDKIYFILSVLIKAIYANGKKIREEVDQYFKIGKLMGVSFQVMTFKLNIDTNLRNLLHQDAELKETILSQAAAKKRNSKK